MAIVRSFGALQSLGTTVPSWSSAGSIGVYGASPQTYAALYRTQPSVRTVVDFIARNIAQLGLHAYRRITDVDRERLSGHELIGWLKRPNPSTTRYRLIETLMQDLGVYFNAFWLKVRTDDALGLVRLPPEEMQVRGSLQIDEFVWTPGGKERVFAPSEIVYFGGYDPSNPLLGLSPLETLRRLLAEEYAANQYREAYWNNAARMDGVIERPATAKTWSPEQKQSFREQWTAMHTGASNAGRTAVLEDGMQFKPAAHSAESSEYIDARKLSREEVAAAYHIPLPMVGILDHATFSNIREQHKHLYQDCLGPWLVMIEEELERQLLPEADDVRDVYLEFNIAEKLKGSFEEQAAALQSLVGAPVMTRNEGRGRLNLPSIKTAEADELVTPLNMSGAEEQPDDDEAIAAEVIDSTRMRQRARLQKVPKLLRPAAFQEQRARWDRELADDLTRARAANNALAQQLEDEAHA